MSARVHKKIRKAAKKQLVTMLRQIGRLPFKQRIWFAWKIIRGVKN